VTVGNGLVEKTCSDFRSVGDLGPRDIGGTGWRRGEAAMGKGRGGILGNMVERFVAGTAAGDGPRNDALILNWFRARGQVSTGAVEGLNNDHQKSVRVPDVQSGENGSLSCAWRSTRSGGAGMLAARQKFQGAHPCPTTMLKSARPPKFPSA
jgi:hypothetical protein